METMVATKPSGALRRGRKRFEDRPHDVFLTMPSSMYKAVQEAAAASGAKNVQAYVRTALVHALGK